jgi:hypothetical protein
MELLFAGRSSTYSFADFVATGHALATDAANCASSAFTAVKSAANVAGAVTAGEGDGDALFTGEGDALGAAVGDLLGFGDGDGALLGSGVLLRVGAALGAPVGVEPDGAGIGAGPGPAPPPEHADTAIAYANAAHAARSPARACTIKPPRSEA